MRKLEVLLDGLGFAEPPRWREDRLWFSDLHARKVKTADLDAEGPLRQRRLWARLEGAVTERIALSRKAFAGMLGGPERTTPFILGAEDHRPVVAREKRTGRIEIARVVVPGAGLP